MRPTVTDIRLAQSILNRTAKRKLKLDGVFGPKSEAEAGRQIKWEFIGRPSQQRWVAAIIQYEAVRLGFALWRYDAFWGPNTADASERLQAKKFGASFPERPDETLSPVTKSVRCWTPSDSQMRAHYGTEGTNQVRAKSPFPLKLDWDLRTTLTEFSCHRLVKDDIEAALEAIWKHYGTDVGRLGIDRFGGCLNVRLKRGGKTMSAHSWGTAIDFFPTQNQMRWGKDRAAFALPVYKEFLKAWNDVGWMSLGVCYNFDWMHFQKNP